MLGQPRRQIRRYRISPLLRFRKPINVPQPEPTPHTHTIKGIVDQVDDVADICGLNAFFDAFPETDAGADGGGDIGGFEEGFVVFAEVFGGVFELDAEVG